MKEVIDFCFKDKQSQYIAITIYGVTWVNNINKHTISLDKQSLKLAINYLLDQCIFNVRSLTFRQSIGIPMGSDPAPFMANLFLVTYESKWVLHTKKSNLQKEKNLPTHFAL